MITIPRAVKLAYDWHGGGGSALYQFASCNGTIHSENHRSKLEHEIRDARRTTRTRTESKELDALLRHVLARKVNYFVDVQGDYGYGYGYEHLDRHYTWRAALASLSTYKREEKHMRCSHRVHVSCVRIKSED